MMNLALMFLVVALIAGVLGFTGIAGAAANIAWILFVVGLILALVFFISGRRRVVEPVQSTLRLTRQPSGCRVNQVFRRDSRSGFTNSTNPGPCGGSIASR